MSDASQDKGFTLVEVIIAMFIFSLVSIGSMAALTNALQNKTQMDERLEDISQFEAARALMKSDFANVLLRPSRDSLGTFDPYVLKGGVDSLVTFTRAGRTNPGGLATRSDLQRVSYLFENGNLIRRVLPVENPAPQSEPKDRILFHGLENMSVNFWKETGISQLRSTEDLRRILTRQPSHLLLPTGQTSDFPFMISFEGEFENGDRMVQLFEVSL